MRVELKQVSLNDSTSLTFPNATYQNTMEKREYKIEFLNIGQLNRNSLEGISKAFKLYLDCFNNPFSSGCLPPTKGCAVSNITTSSTAIMSDMIEILLEQDNSGMELTCIRGSFKTQQSPSKPTRSRRSGDLFPCCPNGKNLVCHGCNGVNKNGKVKVTVCPKGFKCLGQVTGGNGGNTFSINNNSKKTSLTIVHYGNKLLYRQRRPTETKNTVRDLVNLHHLKVIHKVFGLLENKILYL